jgi:hypothetical protein
MGYYGEDSVRELSFDRVDARKLEGEQLAEVQRLMFASLRLDYPHRSPKAIDRAVKKREENRKNLNKTVPGAVEGTWQRYKDPTSVMVYDALGNLVVYLSSSDNSSSRSNSPFPRLEIEAKLRLTRYLNYRYHAIGVVAAASGFRPRTRQPKPDVISVVDVAGFVSMAKKPAEQPVAPYLWDRELWLRQAYSSWGAIHKPDEVKQIGDFEEGNPIVQERWTVEGGITAVQDAILGKRGGRIAINHALQSASIANLT